MTIPNLIRYLLKKDIMKNKLNEELNRMKHLSGILSENDSSVDKHHYPKEMIKGMILEGMGDIVEDDKHYFSFILMPIAIDFLGKCISSDKTFAKNENSAVDFNKCINELMPTKYRKVNEDVNLHSKLRNGMLNMLKPKDGVGLTHAKEADELGLKHLDVKDGDVVLVIEELWADIKKAANTVINKTFSDNDKMSKPFIDVPMDVEHDEDDI